MDKKSRIATAKELIKIAKELTATNALSYNASFISAMQLIKDGYEDSNKTFKNLQAQFFALSSTYDMLIRKNDKGDEKFYPNQNKNYNIEEFNTRLERYNKYLKQIAEKLQNIVDDLNAKTGISAKKFFDYNTNESTSLIYLLANNPNNYSELKQQITSYNKSVSKFNNKNATDNEKAEAIEELKKIAKAIQEIFSNSGFQKESQNIKMAFDKGIKLFEKAGKNNYILSQHAPVLLTHHEELPDIDVVNALENKLGEEISPSDKEFAVKALDQIITSMPFIDGKIGTIFTLTTSIKEQIAAMQTFRDDKNTWNNCTRIMSNMISKMDKVIDALGIKYKLNQADSSEYQGKEIRDRALDQKSLNEKNPIVTTIRQQMLSSNLPSTEAIKIVQEKINEFKEKSNDFNKKFQDEAFNFSQIFMSLNASFTIILKEADEQLKEEKNLFNENIMLTTNCPNLGIGGLIDTSYPGNAEKSRIIDLLGGLPDFFKNSPFLSMFTFSKNIIKGTIEQWKEINSTKPQDLFSNTDYQTRKSISDFTKNEWNNFNANDFNPQYRRVLMEIKRFINQHPEAFKIENDKVDFNSYVNKKGFEKKSSPQVREYTSSANAHSTEMKTAGFVDWMKNAWNIGKTTIKNIFEKFYETLRSITDNMVNALDLLSKKISSLNKISDHADETEKSMRQCNDTLKNNEEELNNLDRLLDELLKNL